MLDLFFDPEHGGNMFCETSLTFSRLHGVISPKIFGKNRRENVRYYASLVMFPNEFIHCLRVPRELPGQNKASLHVIIIVVIVTEIVIVSLIPSS
jgi:hypothetical protein